MAQKLSINKLLTQDLVIPIYQRPYKWTIKNISDLLTDISKAIEDYEKYKPCFKYRIGTIIAQKKYESATENKRTDEKCYYNIVDGQQRTISLILLKYAINCKTKNEDKDNLEKFIAGWKFQNKISQTNIHNNFIYIKDRISLQSDEKIEAISKAFEDILEVIFISVEKETEAFQLFDSQNARGKALDPHDLLKAYHLREMKSLPYEMQSAVTKWESKDSSLIKELFDSYLFPIWNWAHGKKTRPFTAKEIDRYKGISEYSTYTYAKRANKASPCYQITEPFIAGADFFGMVNHYLDLLETIKNELISNTDLNEDFNKIANIEGNDSTGFKYAMNLFYCVILFYYDKFHYIDKMIVKRFLTWAFMLRVDMQNLGFDSINKYAIGDKDNEKYTNKIPMFEKIFTARLHSEISCLPIRCIRESSNNEAASKKWNNLYEELQEINGIL